VGEFVDKNSYVATILGLGIEHRTAVDPMPAALKEEGKPKAGSDLDSEPTTHVGQ
jgi:hypothetical protein